MSLRKHLFIALGLTLLTALLFLGLRQDPATANRAADARAEASFAIKDARPALWLVADKDTTIYLFGTIHILPKGLKWRTAEFDAAVRNADMLVLEVGNLDDKAAIAGAMMNVALLPAPLPLAERVPPASREKLAKLVKASGVPAAALERFEDWAAAVTLTVGILNDIGLSSENGVEEQLRAEFRAAKKPLSGLETAAEQFSYFDTMSGAAQQALLLSVIEEAGNPRDEFAKMLGSWASGDEAAIAVSFDDEMQTSPELVDKLIRQRNANWARWVEERLKQPGQVMVAVGAGHLAGRDSVQAMLRAKKIGVQRVQ